MNKLGRIIENYRNKKGLSLREFAKKCELSHSTIDRLEKGIDTRNDKQVDISLEYLKKIAKGLDKSLVELLIVIGEVDIAELKIGVEKITTSNDVEEIFNSVGAIIDSNIVKLDGEILTDEKKKYLTEGLNIGLNLARKQQ